MSLNEFLEHFREAANQYNWMVVNSNRKKYVRTREDGKEFCPITTLARYEHGKEFDQTDFFYAADLLGLTRTDAICIVRAADDSFSRQDVSIRELRYELLEICRLRKITL